MRLDYKLLWIEDAQDWVATYEDSIRDFLYDIGFKLSIKNVPRVPDLETIDSLELANYHLILMDYELGAGLNGKDIINRIRESGTITEIVFYSANAHFQNIIRDSALEGVYWASRDDEFENKIKQVIELTIRRVMDLPAMRGLAVTEVSDIDYLMSQIISDHHEKLTDDEKVLFRKKIYDKIKKWANTVQENTCKCETQCLTDINEILNLRTLDSDKKWRSLKNFISEYIDDQYCIEIFEQYRTILGKRNDLAHGYTEIDENGVEYIIGMNKKYTQEDTLELRKTLLEHRENIETIAKKMGIIPE